MPEGYSPGPKWWPLQRAFRNLPLLFPGSGGFVGPNQVRDDVQLVEQLYRATVAQDVRFRVQTVRRAAAGATEQELTAEPQAGYFRIPLRVSLRNTNAANTPILITLAVTASARDPWSYDQTTNVDVDVVRSSTDRFVSVPLLPLMRGFQWLFTWQTMTIGQNLEYVLYELEVPAELATLDVLRAVHSTFVHNNPLP